MTTSKKTAKKPTQIAAGMPLNKYIAQTGICSRRNAVELIKDGCVTVNGKVITAPGHRVISSDAVKVNNKLLAQQEHVYVMLNKPRGVVTTLKDQSKRRTVVDLVTLPKKVRVFPVGRLDINTTGVLIMTNDGDLAHALAHPSNEISKVYDVTTHRAIEEKDIEAIKRGVRLNDGVVRVDDCQLLSEAKRNKMRITLHSGKNRVVRRLFEHLRFFVERLDRVKFAGLAKKDLPLGAWRYLTQAEIERLKSL